jgi:hypothetical protein
VVNSGMFDQCLTYRPKKSNVLRSMANVYFLVGLSFNENSSITKAKLLVGRLM